MKRGIFVEGPITVPAAAAILEKESASAEMKLKYHCITQGRYFKAGEDVPDPPPSFAKYAVSEDGDAVDLPNPEPAREAGRFRGSARPKRARQ